MQNSNQINLKDLISKIEDDRKWLLREIDSGKYPLLRKELANLEREISKFILRVKESNSEL